jgi:hypothetical protein
MIPGILLAVYENGQKDIQLPIDICDAGAGLSHRLRKLHGARETSSARIAGMSV